MQQAFPISHFYCLISQKSSPFCFPPTLPAFFHISFTFQSWTGSALPSRQNTNMSFKSGGKRAKGKSSYLPFLIPASLRWFINWKRQLIGCLCILAENRPLKNCSECRGARLTHRPGLWGGGRACWRRHNQPESHIFLSSLHLYANDSPFYPFYARKSNMEIERKVITAQAPHDLLVAPLCISHGYSSTRQGRRYREIQGEWRSAGLLWYPKFISALQHIYTNPPEEYTPPAVGDIASPQGAPGRCAVG